jgi:hypothetical protein
MTDIIVGDICEIAVKYGDNIDIDDYIDCGDNIDSEKNVFPSKEIIISFREVFHLNKSFYPQDFLPVTALAKSSQLDVDEENFFDAARRIGNPVLFGFLFHFITAKPTRNFRVC